MHPLRDRPAMWRAVLAMLLVGAPLGAQVAVRSASALLAAPNGRELATVRSGASVRVGSGASAVRQGHTQVTLDGFVDASLLGPGRDSFPNVIKAPSGARLRTAGRGDASIAADLRDGMGVTVVSRSGSWVRVRRTGWIATPALAAAGQGVARGRGEGGAGIPGRMGERAAAARTTQASPAAAPQDSVRTPRTAENPPGPPPAGALTNRTTVDMKAAPDGRTTARVDSGVIMIPLARDNGWTRVRVEGWVRDADVIPADTALRLSLSGADVRADPERYRGTVVRWDVEFIAIQRADQLRRDLRSEEPYLLARGPGTESGLLYIAIPPALMRDMERFQPLQVITVTARIRVGRSEPAGVPVLDLLGAVRK